jgi:uncharacterized membrane protein
MDTLLQLYVRKHLSLDDFKNLARMHGYDANWSEALTWLTIQYPTISQLIDMVFRNQLTEKEACEIAEKLGFPAWVFDRLMEISRPLLAANILITLFLRGELSEDEFKSKMKHHGWRDEDIEKIVKASLVYPSPSDVVRFAVREVYTPEIVEKYGLLEDLPKEYLEMAKKVGLSEEFAKQYWAAHWELPSITQGFEMFHRGIISEDELKTLLRTLDVMPYWRDKIIQLSYNLPTRVDLRRMYAIGVITEDELFNYYRKLGYAEDDARKLTEWTKKEYMEEERTLAKNQIKELYLLGEIDEEKAREYLKALGYAGDEQDFIILLWQHEKLSSMQKEVINYLTEMYKAGIIDYDKYADELGKLNLKATTLQTLLAKASRMKIVLEKPPSESNLKRWYQKRLLSWDEVAKYLRMMGYSDKVIQCFQEDWSK